MMYILLVSKVQVTIAFLLFILVCVLYNGTAHATVILTDANNELPNSSMAGSYIPNSAYPFGVEPIGNKGYLVVGSGAFDVGLFAITYESPTSAPFNISIEHASICNGGNPYGYSTGIDHPNGGTNPTTFFYALPATFSSINQRSEVSAARDCANLDKTLAVGSGQMTLLPNGKYGGVVMVALYSEGANSQQNSFRLIAPAGISLGYSQQTIDNAESSLKGLPDGEKLIMDAFFPSWREIENPKDPGYKTTINIANTALPSDGRTDFKLNFHLDYCSVALPAGQISIRFYDADDAAGGGTLQSTNGWPNLNFVLESRPKSDPGAWPTTLLSQRLTGGDKKFDYLDLPALSDAYYYSAKVSGLSRPNALQFTLNTHGVNLANNGNGNAGCDVPPSCDITSVTNMSFNNRIAPGERFRFNTTTTNAGGYNLGVNGPAWADAGSLGNYIVTGNQYIRSPINANGANDVTAFGYGDSGPFNQGFYAPSTPGTYTFNWGLVVPGVKWAADTCAATVVVVDPDVAPTIDITQSCTYPFAITIAVNDPNYSSNGGSPQINYTVDGTAQAPVTARTHSFAMPNNGTTAVAITANSLGVNASPPGGAGTLSGSAAANFARCADEFTAASQPQLPALDDSELPTKADFAAFVALGGKATKVNGGPSGINTTATYFFNRGGTYNAGTIVGGSSIAINPNAVVNAFSLTSASTALAVQTRNLSLNVPALPAFQAGDYICSRLTISPSKGLVDLSGNIFAGSVSGSDARVVCIAITDKPYVKVFGSDVLAGSGFGSTCSGMPNANVTAYARNTGGGWVGGGTQFGVFASGTVTGFASSSIAAPAAPSSRVFANTNTLGSVFGGLFGSPSCADDFWASKSTSVGVTAATPLNALSGAVPVVAPGQYQFAANSTLSAAAEINAKIAIYIDGDATITSNITTAAGPWASTAAIPSVYVVVRGNIYISPNVTRLDGVYVAMPKVPATNIGTPADGGRIYTCTDNGAAPNTTELLGACRNNRLVVNGSFVAKRINFLRTGGTLRNATTAAVPQPATCTAANPVTIYKDYKFTGASRTLAEGSYKADVGIIGPVGYREISSVKVPAGCRAVLLDETTGQSKELLADWTVVDGTSPFNDATTRIDVTSLPVAQKQLGLLWSTTGPIEPANYDCALFNEPSDSWWTSTVDTSGKTINNADNYLCARKSYNLGLAFSATGPIGGKTCVLVNEPGDTNGWSNNYICSTTNLGMQFTSNGGSIGIPGMYCTGAVYEPNDTHMVPLAWWLDNYLCEPLAPLPAAPPIVGETSTSTNIAEIFNFTPDTLMSVPSPITKQTIGSFDSVISLPPSL